MEKVVHFQMLNTLSGPRDIEFLGNFDEQRYIDEQLELMKQHLMRVVLREHSDVVFILVSQRRVEGERYVFISGGIDCMETSISGMI